MSLVAACGATSLKSITSASSLSFLGTTVSMKPPLQTKINTRHTGINHYITALDLLVHLIKSLTLQAETVLCVMSIREIFWLVNLHQKSQILCNVFPCEDMNVTW